MSRENADLFFQHLGTTLNVPSLVMDEAGLVGLEFDGVHTLVFQYLEESNALYMYTELGTLAPEELEKKAVELLQANLFGTQTGGATFALEPAQNTLIFSYLLPVAENMHKTMQDQVEHFLHFAEYWREVLWGTQTNDAEFPCADINSMMKV